MDLSKEFLNKCYTSLPYRISEKLSKGSGTDPMSQTDVRTDEHVDRYDLPQICVSIFNMCHSNRFPS
jgi:hypothetical protein